MPTQFACPSALFPALPAVTLTAPEGWVGTPAPGSAIAVRATVPDGEFAPNVVVTLNRYLADYSLELALSGLRTELEHYPEHKVDEPFDAVFGEDRYVVVNTALTHPQFGSMVQVHAYTSFVRGELKDVVHVVGSCAGAQLARDYPLLQQVMESTRVSVS
ncbi:hypothetical protein [Jatrophihabitans sp.]|uniref:hypothetical protein n=1 Tax=Jatrophihabitans sp. TaxID=1932789 RepID=UPI0030C6E9A1|nr:hypothetical protein [Jatrophihabitans sp.]